MQPEDQEQEIEMQQEPIMIGGLVNSVNGQTGDVVLTTSDLENTANFQNANDVANSISAHNQSTSAHQDIRQLITNEATARYNADNNLQGQIDAITSASDVVDIVGTYADLQAYDTQHLKDNDVIKVLQDETHNDAMTYYRWSTSTETWTYIGAEGPYYTKSETNTLLDDKLDKSTVPDGFFDGPATVTPAQGTSIEIEGGLKLKSVEFYGDTTQPDYTGVNLWDVNNPYKDGYSIPANGVESENSSFAIYGNFESAANTNYTISAMGGVSVTTLRIHAYDLNGDWVEQIKSIGMSANTTISEQFTSPNYPCLIRISASKILSQQQLVTSNPTPDYPQPINVVTGTQTITITDGDSQTETYTVNLGSIELCKIGDYQDYIYKSGDNWYLHKETGKKLFDGTETWGGSAGKFSYSDPTIAAQPLGVDEPIIAMSNYLEASNYSAIVNDLADNIIAGYYNGGQLRTRTTGWSTHTEFETWLTTHNMTVYYALATSSDSKITSTTLTKQLNAILDAGLYQPTTTISASGNLPAILSVEAFTENLNSLLEIASEPNENVFVGTDGVSAGVSGLVPAPATTDAGKFLKADGTWASGGGGGTSYTAGTGIDITSDVISVDTSVIQEKLSAGSNVSISNSNVISATDTTYTAGSNVSISAENVISATDTTYSNFTGTDGNTDGTAGLVPAPETTDVDKFLKSDGTWATAGGGGGPTVVQTTGTSQTDVMSQNATTSMVFYDPSTKYSVMIGNNSGANTPQNAVCIGHNIWANTESVVIGENAKAITANGVAIGRGSSVSGKGSVALGDQTVLGNNTAGVVSIKPNVASYSYNNSGYRLLTGLYAGQNANDAVNVGQVNSLIDAINSALNTNIPHIGA